MLVYKCSVCDYIYHMEKDEQHNSTKRGFQTLPDDWRCPQCGSRKICFHQVRLEEQD